MKYCRKCGMLLEDTHLNCIRCGADVTKAENVSMYPIEVMETLEQESQRKKASGKIVAMIIGLVAVLVGLVLFFMNGLGGAGLALPKTGIKSETGEADTAKAEPAVEELPEEEAEPVNDPTPTPEPTPEPSSKEVKDSKGTYYDYVTEADEAGNVILTTVLPKELSTRELYTDYEVYDDRYPFSINFTAADQDNAVRFTYLSPKRLWYKVSETGKGRSDEMDMTNYMTYFKYDGDKSYLEPLLKQSYPGAKFEIVNEYDVSQKAVSRIEELAKAKNKELFGDIGDYGHIGENTTYANMDYESSAKVYEYEITLKDKNILYCKYYIPSMALNLMYANSDSNDRGNLTEWYNLAILCFESGNIDDYDDYSEAFDIFAANTIPTDLFMYISESYGKEIQKGIEEGVPVDPLDKVKLAKYGNEYSGDAKPDEFDAGVLEVLRSAGALTFSGTNATLYSTKSNKVAFFDKAAGRIFFSPEEDEYPGDEYEELKLSEAETESNDTADKEPEAAEEESKPEDKPKSKPKQSGVE